MLKKLVSTFILILILFPMGAFAYAQQLYLVGPGDVLEISVWRDETLSRVLVIPPDGILAFPLVGDIQVAGQTVTGIRGLIKKELMEFVPDASVTVILKEINSLKVYVIGQVKNPGEFPITLETRVMQVLAQAKGLTPFAAERDIHILRYSSGKTQKIGFDYKEVLKGNNLDQDILLQRGDVIVVP